MLSVIFEERAVAFIDVLGFSPLVNGAALDEEKRIQLERLVNLLESAIPVLDNGVSRQVLEHLIPRHLYVSDSIILSAPLDDVSMKSYKGLEIVVMRVIQLTHRLLDAGYLLRGGITVGKVWHGDANIVGPAYQDAYELERTVDHPCGVLSESAKQVWSKGFGASSRMCVKNGGTLMVNGLHDYYVPDRSHGGVERAYSKYRVLVKENIKCGEPEKLAKWQWFGDYLESEASEAKKWPGCSVGAD